MQPFVGKQVILSLIEILICRYVKELSDIPDGKILFVIQEISPFFSPSALSESPLGEDCLHLMDRQLMFHKNVYWIVDHKIVVFDVYYFGLDLAYLYAENGLYCRFYVHV